MNIWSPLSFLRYSVGRFISFNLSSYDNPSSSGTIFVAILCALIFLHVSSYGEITVSAYSIFDVIIMVIVFSSYLYPCSGMIFLYFLSCYTYFSNTLLLWLLIIFYYHSDFSLLELLIFPCVCLCVCVTVFACACGCVFVSICMCVCVCEVYVFVRVFVQC